MGLCRLRLVMGAEKGPRGVCSGAFGVGAAAVGIVAGRVDLWPGLLSVARGGVTVGGMKKSRLAAGVGLWPLCALPGPVVYDPVALGVGDAGELV